MLEHDVDIQEYQKIYNELYAELTQPNRIIRIMLLWAFVVLAVIIPIQIICIKLITEQNSLTILQIPISFDTFELLFFTAPLLCIIGIGYSHIKFVATFNDRVQLFKEMQTVLKGMDRDTKSLEITETQHYKLIIRSETIFVLGTFFAACLWFLVPSQNRLEPITIIYGFGTAIFEYYRSKLEIPNPLDRLIENR